MQTLIERFVKNSLKGDLYDKAIECLRALREACVKEDEAQKFNTFMHKRVKQVLGKESTYGDFFKRVVQSGLTLITKHES